MKRFLCLTMILAVLCCAAAAESQSETMTLSFIGDCSLGDAVQFRNSSSGLSNAIRTNGYDWPFSTTVEYLSADDCTFANLEVVLTTHYNLKADKVYPLVGQPDFVQCLVEGSVEVVNTVNNHSMDFKGTGYNDTLATLKEAGIDYFGSCYWDKHPEWDIITVREVKGCKIGMVGFTYGMPKVKFIEQRVKKLREQGCQLVIVSLHWGRETYLTPQSGQFDYAKKVIDCGADVVWGHHPHVLQPVYFYQGKPIFFSTGNFIFGTMSDVDPYTGIFRLTYDLDEEGNPTLRMFDTVPLLSRHKHNEFRPQVLTEESSIIKFRSRLYNSKKISKMIGLPKAFLDTGYVYVMPDGSLSVEEPGETAAP